MNRAQVSLIIGDDTLYSEFINPLKTEKKLMPLIVRLLGSYYYNPEVQQLVDGVSIDDLKDKQDFESDDTKELRQKLQDIRASVQLFGMYIEDTNATLEEGMQMVSSFAKATGSASGDNSSTGSVPRISVKNVEDFHSSLNDGKQPVVEDVRIKELQDDMLELKSSMNLILDLLKSGSPSVISNSVSNNNDMPSSNDSRTVTSESTTVVESVKSEISGSTEEEREDGRSKLKGMLLGGGVGGFM